MELPADSLRVAVAPPRSPPLHSRAATNYWNKYVEADRLLYFAYNACAEDPKVGPFAKFAEATFAFMDQTSRRSLRDRPAPELRRQLEIIKPLLEGSPRGRT